MNLTVKRIPEEVYARLRDSAEAQGRSLNAQIIRLLAAEAAELERRRKMQGFRKVLDRFVASLPKTEDSTGLIREDRRRR